ncbi:MAG: hypothetical protein MUC65_02625 [Pontiellaceae bacterium]|jgi:hypothetical protein|nr:hypothetical protein [Pontiellaceae bacterium]
MDLFLEPIEPFVPTWGSPEEWNSAYEKLESYLRAHEVDSHLHRARLITTILHRISFRGQEQTRTTPLATLAIEEANTLLNEWFTRIMDLPADTDTSFTAADGRVALFLCDGPLRWPYAFLETQNVPNELKTAMRKSLMRAGPELQISSMVPRPIDLGLIPEFADDAMDALNRMPVIKALIGWLIFLAFLTFLFWRSRSWHP